MLLGLNTFQSYVYKIETSRSLRPTGRGLVIFFRVINKECEAAFCDNAPHL